QEPMKMPQVEWEKLDAPDVPVFLDEINPHIEPIPFNPDSTTIRKRRLPFYPDYAFLEMTDLSAIPSVRKYAIYKKDDVNVVNWTNQTIYDVNEKAPVRLDDKNVADYIRFFFTYVRGRHGRFIVIESVDEIHWRTEPPAQGRKVIQEMVHPIKILSKDEDGTYKAEAFMLFKDSLFKTVVHVTPDGMVNLSEEELKIEGMPIVQDMAAE